MIGIFFNLFVLVIVFVVVGKTALLHSIKDVAFIVQKVFSLVRWKFLYYVIKVRNISLKFEAIMIPFYLLSFVV